MMVEEGDNDGRKIVEKDTRRVNRSARRLGVSCAEALSLVWL